MEIKETNHGAMFYRPMFTSNGNVIAYPPIGFHTKEEAKKWIVDNLQDNEDYTPQIIEEHYITLEIIKK